jgi:hypothetical protein
MEHNFITYDIKKNILEYMQEYNLDTLGEIETAAMESADELVPVYTKELLEQFFALWSVCDDYESRHGLGWADIVDAVRDIVGQVYAEIAHEVINEYDNKGDE